MALSLVLDQCPYCKGTGIKTSRCQTCGGSGKVEFEGKDVLCPTCKGSGQYVYRAMISRPQSIPCPRCEGKGKVLRPVRGTLLAEAFEKASVKRAPEAETKPSANKKAEGKAKA
jgi:DnaJ-class molecular chaperone